MTPLYIIMALFRVETAIVRRILRSPGFHHGVRAIHKKVDYIKHGRNPHEPLRPGEATEDPTINKTSFFKHFVDEVKNQLKGTPSEPPPPRPPTRTKQ